MTTINNQFFNHESETMKTTSQSIESEIVAKGLTAPRVTPDDIEANIFSEHYFTAEQGVIGSILVMTGEPQMVGHSQHLGLLTICVLILRNGFTVTGESACASLENFDAELGRKISRANAVKKMWPRKNACYAPKQSLSDRAAQKHA